MEEMHELLHFLKTEGGDACILSFLKTVEMHECPHFCKTEQGDV
jgi:hypothetical protein